MIEVEAAIIASRIHQDSVMRAALFRLAISSIPNQSVKPESTKKSAKAFEKLMKGIV